MAGNTPQHTPGPPGPQRSAADRQKERIARAYAERNALAVAFIQMALAQGWKAGRAVDPNPRRDWGADWRHMLCARLPTGELLQWHLSPEALPLIDDLPVYSGRIEGLNFARQANWPDALARALQKTLRRAAGQVEQTAGTPLMMLPAAIAAKPASPAAMATKAVMAKEPVASAAALRPVVPRVKASYWGPRTFRVEECATVGAALAWLIRNRHTVVKDAQIEEPGHSTRNYTAALLSELAAKMEGKAVGAAGMPASSPNCTDSLISETAKPKSASRPSDIFQRAAQAARQAKSDLASGKE